MPLLNILVPVRGDGLGENNLAHAAAIARSNASHVDVLHCRSRPEDMVPQGVVVSRSMRKQIKAFAESLANEEQEVLETEFKTLLGRLGLEESENPSVDRPTATWREEEGKISDLIGIWGRLADLIVVSRPDRGQNLGMNTLMAALNCSGRPVLMCPMRDTHPEHLGRRIAIAWNGGLEAARAIGLTLDLLRKAESVVILGGGTGHAANSAQALQRYLEFNGITAQAQNLAARSRPGPAILETASVAGADMVVMGAYSRSREREVLFGGATQHIVDHADLPVVLVH